MSCILLPFSELISAFVRTLCFVTVLCTAAPIRTPAETQNEEIVFGLIPALSPEAMVQRYLPLAEHLTKQSGVTVTLEGAPDYATYMRRVLEEARYDLIITGGDFYRLAERRKGYRAIARVAGTGVQAIIVADVNDNFTSLSDVPKGARVASIGELALMHLLGAQTLRENGIMLGENATLVQTPSHNAAMLSVLSSRVDIAIIAAPFFAGVDAEIREKVDVIARTASAPHHPIAVGPQVPNYVADRLTEILLALPDTTEGQAALNAMSFPGFAPVEPGLYDTMDWAADDLEKLLGLESN